MLKLIKNSFLLSPALLAAIAISSVSAQEKTAASVLDISEVAQFEAEPITEDGLEQVTSVAQLTDVRPTDWAFQALQSLVERYGCIVGYPDKTFRGNRALTRYEFAAGLNACLDKIQELIAAATADFVKKEDLEIVKKLQEEFAAELSALRGRVEGLEVRTATLEKQQFSTTTKISGEVVFGVVSAFTGQDAIGRDIPRTTIVGNRVRLDFDTTFTGADLLRTRLQATSLNALSGASTFTPEGDLRFAGAAFDNDNNNSVGIDALLYQFPVGEKLTVVLEANAGAIDDFTDTINPFLDGDGGIGALTQFGTRNPIYYLLNGTGIGLQYQLNDFIEISAGYLANDASSPSQGGGLFNGPYGAIAQLTLRPSEQFTVGLTYIHAYNTDFTANGSTGSNRANLRSTLANNPLLLDPFTGLDIPTSSNAYGAGASFQFSPKFVINGSVGYTKTRTLATRGLLPRGDIDIWNWAVGLAFPDLLKDGSVGGIIVGMEPRVSGVSSGLRAAIGRDPSTSIHVEAFYQYRVNDNISITPGVVWLTAPDHNERNQDVVIGTVRTTFTF
ncbi:iron uptake porin [Phormidium sp. CLA17]|uniref:iron uptake porin n=1 Tax=Leptolyngbya sp. Cla-17 TaxID=2803751 RepID=UPI001490ACC1|nr:iron uptake porin [Leptolyngbya sp. Cla-17]MBM0743523.1 iron uptake porin [Leptolyngbya sp. Cla-17]